jgi:hypothetical protein
MMIYVMTSENGVMVVEVSSDQEGRKGEKSKHSNKKKTCRDGRIVCVLEGNCGLPTKLVLPKLMSLFFFVVKKFRLVVNYVIFYHKRYLFI